MKKCVCDGKCLESTCTKNYQNMHANRRLKLFNYVLNMNLIFFDV